jgi:DNA polymerase
VAKIMAGLDISPEDSERIVAEFRATNPKITSLWERMQRAFRQAKGKVWVVKTEAGRAMRYFNPADGQAAAVKAKPPTKFYGGKLVENLIQATARDVMAGMVLQIEAAGYPVVLHVHDEIVAEVPSETAAEAMEEIRRIMSTPPAWMPTLPVECEAHLMEVYGK